MIHFRSHSENDEPLTSPPATKRQADYRPAEEPLKSSTPLTPNCDSSIKGGVSESLLSPEQKERIATKKLEAESKRVAALVGAEKLGPSWVEALLSEFKKSYIKEVDEKKKKTSIFSLN